MEDQIHALDVAPVSDESDSYGRESNVPPRAPAPRASGPRAGGHRLERPVRELMTPGVITIPEDASLRQAYRAMVAHRVNSLLVVGAQRGTPLGWVTARGLLAWLDRDPDLNLVGKAVTEQAVAIHPGATAFDALQSLSRAGVSQLMVTRSDDRHPQGVVTPIDMIAPVSE